MPVTIPDQTWLGRGTRLGRVFGSVTNGHGLGGPTGRCPSDYLMRGLAGIVQAYLQGIGQSCFMYGIAECLTILSRWIRCSEELRFVHRAKNRARE